MASVPQSSWFCTLKPIKPSVSSPKTNPRNLKVSSSLGPSGAESPSPNSSNSLDKSFSVDPVSPSSKNVQNPASESAEIREKNDGSVSEGINSGNQGIPSAVKLAMERAKEYKKKKGVMGSIKSVEGSETISGLKGEKRGNLGSGFVEKSFGKKEVISSIDFMGLDFSDKKKSRGLPPGLVPISDPFPKGELPEVEIIVGNASNFEDAVAFKPKTTLEDDLDVYKPKVSTWGVFPRPTNISKTYGGGRVIRPGEVLETAEDKAVKEARTRQLLVAYKSQMGLNIDPKLKAECEMALKDGNSLMDLGKLKEALPFYEKIMDKLVFKSELHGLAALQWSICQDSLNRSNEARIMYEKLQSHPNVQVSKKAKQFVFGFQAMEMMKFTSSTLPPISTGYQNYFEAFIKDKANYPLKEVEVDDAKELLARAACGVKRGAALRILLRLEPHLQALSGVFTNQLEYTSRSNNN